MKIVIASDSHGLTDVLQDIVKKHPDADAFLHCGDSELRQKQLDPWVTVLGNMDWCDFEPKKVIDMGRVNIFMAHSHLYGYGNRMEQLADDAIKHNCQIALFGHSHVFFDKVVNGVHCINPGSLLSPRDNTSPSYAILHIDQAGNSTVERVNVKVRWFRT